MYKYLSKNGILVGSVIAVISLLIMVVPILLGYSEYDALPEDLKVRSVSPQGNIFFPGIYVSVVLLVIAIVVTILLSLFGVFTNMKDAKKGLIAFGILVVLFFALYSMAAIPTVGTLAAALEKFSISDGLFKLISGGIQGSIWMMVAAFATIFIMEVWNFFKNA